MTPTPSYHDLVDAEIIEMIRKAKHPLAPEDIVADLAKRGMVIAAGDPVVYLRRMAIRQADKVVRFWGKGFWDAARPWPAAGYMPKRRNAA